MRRRLLLSLALLAASACAAPQQTTMFVVTTGPYPLYQVEGEWLASRLSGMAAREIDQRIIDDARAAQAQRRPTATDGPWLHSGCLFEVRRTSVDQQDASYRWAYGRVVRCDEPVVTGIPEPQMGMRPREVRVYDGALGYFPLSMLEPYTGDPPAPRS